MNLKLDGNERSATKSERLTIHNQCKESAEANKGHGNWSELKLEINLLSNRFVCRRKYLYQFAQQKERFAKKTFENTHIFVLTNLNM